MPHPPKGDLRLVAPRTRDGRPVAPYLRGAMKTTAPDKTHEPAPSVPPLTGAGEDENVHLDAERAWGP